MLSVDTGPTHLPVCTLPALKIIPEGLALFSFLFFFGRQTLVTLFWLFIIQTNIFPLAWDRLFLLNVAFAELRSRRLIRSDCERLATPASVKVAQIWTFSGPNVGRAHHQTLTVHVSFKQAEKKKTVVQSHTRQRKCLRKVKKAMLLARSNGRDAPSLVPGP